MNFHHLDIYKFCFEYKHSFLNENYFFQSRFIFPNGVKLKVDLAKRLEIIPGEESSDRRYINETFDMFFSEKYIKKQMRNGCAKEKLLTQFRETDRYETMRGEY